MEQRRFGLLSESPECLPIFISSTFHDMQLERDVLSRSIFPRLRGRLGAGVSLQEVDLRWGVTEAGGVNEGAVNICLDEVVAASPLIFGLVGFRVGWRPTLQYLSAAHARRLGDLRVGVSMTELELIYAAKIAKDAGLARPKLFFRSEEFTRRLGHTPDDEAGAHIQRERLKDLGAPVFGYGSRDEFEALAEAQLFEMIASHLHAPGRRKTAPFRAYVERPSILNAIEKAARKGVPVALTGPEGAGVSFLAARFFQAGSPGGAFADGRKTAASMMPSALGASDENPLQETVFDGPDPLPLQFARLLETAQKGSRFVIDHFEEAFPVAALADLSVFPKRLRKDVSLAVTFRDARLLQQARALSWPVVEAPSFEAAEARGFCVDYLKLFAKTLTEDQLQTLTSAPWASRVGPAVLALDELRRFGKFEEVNARLAKLASLKTGEDLAREVVAGLGTIEPEGWRGAVWQALCALSLSLRGLEELEVRSTVGRALNNDALPPHLWSAFRIGLGAGLVMRGPFIDLSGGPLASYVRREIGEEKRQGLLATAKALAKSLASPRREAEEKPRLLYTLGGPESLAELLSQPSEAESLIELGQSYAEGWFALLPKTAAETVFETLSRKLRAEPRISAAPRGDSLAFKLAVLAARLGARAQALNFLSLDAVSNGDRQESQGLPGLPRTGHGPGGRITRCGVEGKGRLRGRCCRNSACFSVLPPRDMPRSNLPHSRRCWQGFIPRAPALRRS